MTQKEKLKEMIDRLKNGIITTKDIIRIGIHRENLRPLVKDGFLIPYCRGVYIKKDSWEDDLFLLQQKYKKGIFSHETALYLLNYSNSAPIQYSMTFPKGYNSKALKQESISVRWAIPEIYSLGITEAKSLCGNPVKIYNLEKTLCDLIRDKSSDIEVIKFAFRKYVSDRNRNINKLIEFTEKLHVKTKIIQWLEILL